MSLPYELYRYAAPGERRIKYHLDSSQQQVRYLPGVEIRRCAQQQLRVIMTGHSHIYQTGSQNIAHFNLADRLGSLSGVVDEQGTLVSRETWYPFGGTASWLTGAQAGAALKFQRYVGKERDASGLIFYGWRYLVPWEMRWLNGDPAGTIDGLNLFCMVRNNPLTLRDRDGRVGDDEPANSVKDTSSAPLPPKKRYIKMHSEPQHTPSAVITPNNDSPPSASPASATLVTPEQPQPGTSTDSGKKRKPVKQTFWCDICNPRQNIGSYYRLNQHYLKIHNIGFVCEYEGCGKKYSVKQQFEEHLNGHTGARPFVCDWNGCGKAFAMASCLTQHKAIHEKSGTFQCLKCREGFCNRKRLNQHNSRIHNNEQIYPCDSCNMKFYTPRKLGQHKKSMQH